MKLKGTYLSKDDLLSLSPWRAARDISKLSDHPRWQIGAVLIRKGTPLAVASNKFKTHPYIFRNSEKGKTLHAEIVLLLKVHNADTIYVYREHADGSLANARPCVVCLAAILESGIKRIYYTIDNGYAMEYVRGSRKNKIENYNII